MVWSFQISVRTAVRCPSGRGPVVNEKRARWNHSARFDCAVRELLNAVNALLKALSQCREGCIEALRRAPPTAEVAVRTRALVAALDNVTERLTGDRQHFWLKPHSSKPSSGPS
jgi:hypothetical protein